MPISETQRVWREADNRSWVFFFGCTGPPARLQCPPYICPETPAWSKTDRAADPYNLTSGPCPINLRALRRVTASQKRGERVTRKPRVVTSRMDQDLVLHPRGHRPALEARGRAAVGVARGQAAKRVTNLESRGTTATGRCPSGLAVRPLAPSVRRKGPAGEVIPATRREALAGG